jgi:NADH dehydrogenase [ubiquinone] 1 alpha subcomplex assembly factor 6
LGLRSLELDHIAYHLSLCNGIVNVLRGIPFRVKRNELPLPLDICAKHSLVQEEVFRRGPDAQGIKDVVLEVATRANDHLNTAKKHILELRSKDKELLASAFCVFLSAVYPMGNEFNNRLLRGSFLHC